MQPQECARLKPVHTNQGQSLKAPVHLPSDRSLPLGAGSVPDKLWWGGRTSSDHSGLRGGPRSIACVHVLRPSSRPHLAGTPNGKIMANDK